MRTFSGCRERGYSGVVARDLSLWWPLLLQRTGSGRAAS